MNVTVGPKVSGFTHTYWYYMLVEKWLWQVINKNLNASPLACVSRLALLMNQMESHHCSSIRPVK